MIANSVQFALLTALGQQQNNENWSCHAKDGEKIFEVTPQNQNEAVNNFEELVKLVKSMKKDPS
ncbi:hypothetical protein MIR68_010425 [Amoeboaphelidium protococcarum]|nr:hypothetical protein MIR68_010425 [Amoeboaphelidium protococcarum]